MYTNKVEEIREEDVEAETTAQIGKEAQESLEQNFTPSLARRLSRQFIEQTRQSIPRSPSSSRDSNRYQSPTRDLPQPLAGPSEVVKRCSTSAISDQTEYKIRSFDRDIRRTNSLLEPHKYDRLVRHSPRRSISLFDDDDDNNDDKLLPPLPKHIMTLGRKYKESAKSSVIGNARRDNFYGCRADKIQEEPSDDMYLSVCKENVDNVTISENSSVSEGTSISVCNSNANLMDTNTITNTIPTTNTTNTTTTTINTTNTITNSIVASSSEFARSCEISPTESSSTLGDCGKSICKSDISRSFENRLLAAENLIKESKLKNLTSEQFNPNLSCNYRDTDKCDKETLMTTSDPLSSASSVVTSSKRRSCIPSLRLRSGSLTRELSADRRKSFAGGSPDAFTGNVNQERSILSKLFRSTGNGGTSNETESKDGDRNQKSKQHRISRFLRPDFFDTPREESQYVKEKEARKAAENERRKSRFIRRKTESKERKEDGPRDEKICKEQKNEINALQKDKLGNVVASSSSSFSSEEKSNNENRERATRLEERQGASKSSFLQSLEKKLERLRSNDESTTSATNAKPTANGTSCGISSDREERGSREYSAPPVKCPPDSGSSLAEVKRTLSVENLSHLHGGASRKENAKNAPSKGRVTSVLGLFKTNADATRQNANSGNRSQNPIMSKLKRRSPPKCAKSLESSPLEEEDVTVALSKIPATKFARSDNKPGKKLPEKVVSECKRSPPKEKSKEKESVKEKKSSREPKKSVQSSTDSSTSSSADKPKLEKAEPSRKSDRKMESPQKIVDNKHAEFVIGSEDKKLIKTKRNISSLISKNEFVAKVDKIEDVDKKSKVPIIKSKEDADKDEINDSRKKKIVRVVKKVVKKSSDENGKSTKPLTGRKKTGIITKKDRSPETPIVTVQGKIERQSENNPDNQTTARSSCSRQTAESDDIKLEDVQDVFTKSINKNQLKANVKEICSASDKFQNNVNVSSSPADISQTKNWNASSSQNCPNSLTRSTSADCPPADNSSSPFDICHAKREQPQLEQQHRQSSRANLKLDLSKIPQHTFRHATPKKDSPKSDSSRNAIHPIASVGLPAIDPDDPATAESSGSDKLMERLSRMTHHANITGNKIIIDKPLRAKDVAELKREVTECAKIIENHMESRNGRFTEQTVDHQATFASDEPAHRDVSNETKLDSSERRVDDTKVRTTDKEPLMRDCISEIFSPEEPESFDSWSICSADLNHNRGDLQSPSPTSPSYSLFVRGDSSQESVIDRIRRRSFYSRFNDRKRPSLTAPPPGMSSVTLPRRFSFNSPRERERNRFYNYGVPRTRTKDRSYISHGDDEMTFSRKSPVDREKYSDALNASSYGHHSPEARTVFDPYDSGLPSFSHDSLRRYTRSPTLDLVVSRAKYHSTDIIADNDLTGISYKSPLSKSFLSDSIPDPSYHGRNVSITLPKKYGSTVGGLEPKSVEYYEEILSPSNPDYLSSRETCRSPLLDVYLNRCENGYNHNGNLDPLQFNTDKSRSYNTDNMEFGEQKRNTTQRFNETKDTSSTATDILSNVSVTERN